MKNKVSSESLYFVAILVPSPTVNIIEELKAKISAKYGTRMALRTPAHITLVAPFLYSDESKLMEFISGFEIEQFKITAEGFGRFSSRCIYVNVEPSPSLMNLYSDIQIKFKGTFPSVRRKVKYSFHPHITIGNRDWSESKFERCWTDLKETDLKVEFEVRRISLLKQTGVNWNELFPG